MELFRNCRTQKFDCGLWSGRLSSLWHDHGVLSSFSIVVRWVWDLVLWCGLLLRPRESLEAEILFLRRQLALYRERGVKPRRVDTATRVTLALLSRCFDWRSSGGGAAGDAIGWHRAGFRLVWRWKSRAGRQPIPAELRELIRRMAEDNPVWGQERIANELLVKLGLRAYTAIGAAGVEESAANSQGRIPSANLIGTIRRECSQ